MPRASQRRDYFSFHRLARAGPGFLLCLSALGFFSASARAVVLWNDPGTTLVHENGWGTDILGGAVKRDDSANDTLYFKFHVDPLSDKDTEEYFAALELFDGDTERLGIGNSLKAWAYSAFFHADETIETNNLAGYIDLHTSKPETAPDVTSGSYQYPRRGVGVTIVFKIQYVPGEDDLVTVWLNPDLGPGASESYQPDSLTSRFNANASFDEIRLRHAGGGGGWSFSDLAIATSFSDFVDVSSARPNDPAASGLGGVRALNFQSWQKEQGLSQSPVRALTQTRDGYIWLGSDDGLTRFDGLRFVNCGIQAGIKCGQVSALLEDSHGAFWVGSADNGLLRWQNHQVTAFTPHNGLPALNVTALAEDAAGRLWIGTEAGLRVWQDGQLLPLKAAGKFNGQSVTALFKDQHGVMWIGVAGAGVFQFVGDAFIPLPGEGMNESLKDPHCLFVDQAGRLWVGAGEDFVLCHDGDHWQRYRIPRNQVRSHVTVLAGEADGTVWAGSSAGGLLAFKDGKSFVMPASAGLAGDLIESFLVDREGRLWVGTEAGLNRLRRQELFALSQGEGLGFGVVQGLAEVTPGVVWAGKPNDGLYRWDGKSFSRLSVSGLSPHDSQITALLVTHDGFCWVATTNNLLLYKDPIAAADEVKIIQPPQPGVIALAEDREGTLWLGTRTGKILQLRANHWLELTNFAQTNAVTALASDADGSLWIGTEGSGLFQFANGAFHYIDRHEGLPGNAIHALYLDAQGALWIGTDNGGLSCWHTNRIENFTIREGVPDNVILQILEDDFGRLWLGTTHGIACVNKSQLDAFAAGRIPAFYPKFFGRAEGMPAEECTGGFFPAGLKTKAGLLWFSTVKGVVVIDPRAQPAATLPPNPVLEEVLVDDVPEPRVSTSETLRITPGKHHVEFRYTGLSFDAPELIHFRYRLEGLDAGWLDAGLRRTAFYSFLPPGNYKFRIAARNNDGVWNEADSALEVIVQRHFWQTWWFIVLVGLGLMILVGGIVRLVVKRKLQRRLKHLEQERALERERTRIAQDLHDEMGAKLCRISFLSEHARRGELPPQELKDQIASISDASREVLHSLDEIVWAVNPQNDTLEHVASYLGQYAQDYFQMTGVQCELDIPAQVPSYPLSSQTRHHLFLAAHEALTNILKHAGATQARIVMRLNQAVFEISISDNGQGFDLPDHELKSELSSPTAGDGLANMRQRLMAIGGQCQIQSTPANGTRIQFIIPLNSFKKSIP
ncbi:MAG TPA: two-component regulator propeller domain-containing protein [Verrucomicrobiae bacterium]